MINGKRNRMYWECPAGKFWKELFAKSWDELVQIRKDTFFDQVGKKFIFRGQGSHGDLKTSIERAFEEFDIDGDDRLEYEKQLIRSFQRKAPYHLKDVGVPELNDTLEWLSLMQHHGAPTRLLDWSYSFYRAIYNAVSKNTRKDKLGGKYESEVWVMNTRWFTDKAEQKLRESIKKASQRTENERISTNRLLAALDKSEKEVTDYIGSLANIRNMLIQYLMHLGEQLPLLYNVTPIGMNERIIYQQGTFVLPGDITKCFMQNLEPYKKDNCSDHLFKINIELEQQERNKILNELNDMNINEAVLFPGLDGFARYLRLKLAFLHKR
jgi:hypothetical protein